MDRTEVIAGVAADLHATEHAIDAAIAQATTLVQSFISARADLSLSPVAATASQAKAMETIAASASEPTPPARLASPTTGLTRRTRAIISARLHEIKLRLGLIIT